MRTLREMERRRLEQQQQQQKRQRSSLPFRKRWGS